MKQLNSLRKIMEKINDLEEFGRNPYKRILMEKEKKNLSYKNLSEALNKIDDKLDYSYQDLRKKLTTGKRIDPEFLSALNNHLKLPEKIDNNEAVSVYHYIKNRPSHSGNPTEVEIIKKRKLYDEAQGKKSDPEKGEYSIDELLLDFADRGEEEFLEDNYQNETDMLKRILLLYRQYPHVITDLLKDIVFEKEDEDILAHIRIEING